MNRVSVTKLINKLSLTNLTPEINTDDIWLYQPEINRPALQLAGFLEHFANERVQIIGNVEYAYIMEEMTLDKRVKVFEQIFRRGIPALIFSRDLKPEAEILSFDGGSVQPCALEDTESYRIMELFINRREMLLRHLME